MEAGELVRRAREEAGLSRSALAARAGVPTSTVSRIEAGSSDPTLTMLSRLIAATGRQLSIAMDGPPGLSIDSLTEAYSPDSPVRKVNWPRLRGFLDQLLAHPGLTADAIESPPRRTGDAAFDALLAGIAEKLADDAGIPRPRWTRSVPPAPTPWEAPGTPARVQRARAQAPAQLAARNIWLAAHDLWRDAA
ncbi:helix-turn-helix domain-containing protein [Kribbella speibonae]|nr:helix-turn-helix transcriptional regulator [Kribbella speibonae]